MSLEALKDYVFTSRYARFRPELGRRETFKESVDRVMDMHKEKYREVLNKIRGDIDFCASAMKDRLVLGSQRALQFGGDPILRKNARLYNCSSSYCDRPRFFQEALWLLLCGCGVGFSVQKHHVQQLPCIHPPTKTTKTFVVPDTIEGWSDALGVLLSSYGLIGDDMQDFCDVDGEGVPGNFHDYVGHFVEFDYSEIRPKGDSLSSGAGTAPGPDPLRRSLEIIQKMLAERVETHSRLRPIDAYDIMMHASDAVLSGGVRRSATLCLFSPDDSAMATAKTGNWFNENPQRGRSNNSALLLRGETSRSLFNSYIKSVKEYGEPGFVWADDTEYLTNPCCEIGMYPKISHRDLVSIDDDQGQEVLDVVPDVKYSGWAFCNLCEINAKDCRTEAELERACKAAAILGTLQAGYTNFGYLGRVSEAIAKREALLGCSMTGMMDNPNLVFSPDVQRKMAKLILDVNEKMAEKIGTRPAARATCVKPAGSTSCILGTSSGIHAHHSRRYLRRVQANATEATLDLYRQCNPRAVEKSVWNPNGTDAVVTFCVEIHDEALTKNDVGALKLLEYVKNTQSNWVEAGRVESRCTKPWLRHNVSNTINVKDDEWDDVAKFIYDNRDVLTGVSLISHKGDLDYPQAPFCSVKDEDELLEIYGKGVFLASGLIVDGIHAFGDNLWAACDAALGMGEDLFAPNVPPLVADRVRAAYVEAWQDKVDWVRRFRQFADRYLGGDKRRCSHCLKDVHNFKLWQDLNREHISVDYTAMANAVNDRNVQADVACSGDKCQII